MGRTRRLSSTSERLRLIYNRRHTQMSYWQVDRHKCYYQLRLGYSPEATPPHLLFRARSIQEMNELGVRRGRTSGLVRRSGASGGTSGRGRNTLGRARRGHITRPMPMLRGLQRLASGSGGHPGRGTRRGTVARRMGRALRRDTRGRGTRRRNRRAAVGDATSPARSLRGLASGGGRHSGRRAGRGVAGSMGRHLVGRTRGRRTSGDTGRLTRRSVARMMRGLWARASRGRRDVGRMTGWSIARRMRRDLGRAASWNGRNVGRRTRWDITRPMRRRLRRRASGRNIRWVAVRAVTRRMLRNLRGLARRRGWRHASWRTRWGVASRVNGDLRRRT